MSAEKDERTPLLQEGPEALTLDKLPHNILALLGSNLSLTDNRALASTGRKIHEALNNSFLPSPYQKITYGKFFETRKIIEKNQKMKACIDNIWCTTFGLGFIGSILTSGGAALMIIAKISGHMAGFDLLAKGTIGLCGISTGSGITWLTGSKISDYLEKETNALKQQLEPPRQIEMRR